MPIKTKWNQIISIQEDETNKTVATNFKVEISKTTDPTTDDSKTMAKDTNDTRVTTIPTARITKTIAGPIGQTANITVLQGDKITKISGEK